MSSGSRLLQERKKNLARMKWGAERTKKVKRDGEEKPRLSAFFLETLFLNECICNSSRQKWGWWSGPVLFNTSFEGPLLDDNIHVTYTIAVYHLKRGTDKIKERKKERNVEKERKGGRRRRILSSIEMVVAASDSIKREKNIYSRHCFVWGLQLTVTEKSTTTIDC